MIYSIHFKRYLKLPLHSVWHTLELMLKTFWPSHTVFDDLSSHLRLQARDNKVTQKHSLTKVDYKNVMDNYEDSEAMFRLS